MPLVSLRSAKQLAKPYVLRALGVRPGDPEHIAADWYDVRLRAFRRLAHIYRGARIEWPRPMQAWCVPFDLAGPRRGEVLIRSIASAVSPGTETAFFSLLPNTGTGFPFYPGYSLAGEVVAVGSGVTGLSRGQLVATEAPHASIAVRPAHAVLALPDNVAPAQAAFLQLGVIAGHGVQRSRIRPGERIAVFGRGVIGQLAIQMARAQGAGEVISVARSRSLVTPVLERWAHRIISRSGSAADEEPLRVDVAIDATGDPAVLHEAIRSVRDGGRVTLLGSSRGVTRAFTFGALADRRITLVGAHISSLLGANADTEHRFRAGGESFLRAVADGSLDVASLIDTEVNPWEVGRFYRDLADGVQRCVGAVLRWDWLDDSDRMARVRYWNPPDLEAVHAATMLSPENGSATHAGKMFRRVPRAVPSGAPPPSATAVRERLGVAMVGCGEQGALNALAAREAPHTSLVMVMDVNEASSRSLGDRLSVSHTTAFEAVLADERVDAVFLNTPHHLHADQAITAMSAGKHVIVEKPMATSLDDAVRMARAARESGVQLSMWLGKRYLPHVVRAKELVSAGILGRLLGAHLTFHSSKPSSYWRGGFTGAGTDWRSRRETSGGGVLIMSGIHFLDWLTYLTGLAITRVAAHEATLNSPAEVEDTVSLSLVLANGALATANISSCVTGARPDVVELRLWGTDGQISLTPPYQFYSSRLVEGRRPGRWHSLAPLPSLRGEGIEYLDRFARAVVEGEEPEIGVADGLCAQALVEAAYRSAREGRAIPVEVPMWR